MTKTLEDFVSADKHGQWHVYVEWRGLRFYMGSYPNYPDAQSICAFHACRHYSLYVTERADSTSINGDNWEFQRRYREWDEAINMPFRVASPKAPA